LGTCHGHRLHAVFEEREASMAGEHEPTYRLTEIVGTSTESVHQAIRNGVAKAAETVRHLDWFEVSQVRGTVVEGNVGVFQVAMKVGFRVED
jgi:flavin-binding protein dodecin